MRLRHIGLAAAGLFALQAPTLASPGCDLLRMCSAQIADEMLRGAEGGCGQSWRAATIRQYRQMSVSPLEQAGPGVCEAVFQTFAVNVRGWYEHRQFCRIPPACKIENLGDLPALPGAE
ncbi:MAG: hypothetical protein R3F55_20310 [Alphaproteobacteria bacterium]